MTPEEHIAKAEALLEQGGKDPGWPIQSTTAAAAAVHVELAKLKLQIDHDVDTEIMLEGETLTPGDIPGTYHVEPRPKDADVVGGVQINPAGSLASAVAAQAAQRAIRQRA